MAKRKKTGNGRTNIAGGRGGQPQRRRTRRNSWQCEKNQKAFLENLAATGNVTLAARMANLTPHGGYMLRLVDPGLRESWRQARAEAVERIKDLLSERAAEGLGTHTIEGKVVSQEMREYSTKLALTLLKMHEAAEGRESGGVGRGPRRPRTADELRAAILEKLEEMHRRLHGLADGEPEEGEEENRPDGEGPEEDGSEGAAE